MAAPRRTSTRSAFSSAGAWRALCGGCADHPIEMVPDRRRFRVIEEGRNNWSQADPFFQHVKKIIVVSRLHNNNENCCSLHSVESGGPYGRTQTVYQQSPPSARTRSSSATKQRSGGH